jgi:hypothetical protein
VEPKEVSRLLLSAARCAESAAHLVLLPHYRESDTMNEMVRTARELLAFADEMRGSS